VTVAVIGAGIAGIGASLAAEEAGRDVLVLEAEDGPGGLVRTDGHDGFGFDRTGHFIHLKNDLLRDRLAAAAVPLDRIERRSAVLVGETLVPYPIQYNLWALGSPATARAVLAELAEPDPAAGAAATFEELLVTSWGETLCELFFRPYNEKLWGRRLAELPADCVGAYLPAVDLELAAAGAREPTDYAGYNGTFLYPSSGRLGDAAEALAAPLAARARYGCAVTAIDVGERALETADGGSVEFEALIATVPLDDLLVLLGEWPAPELFAAAEILNVCVGFRGAVRIPHHWMYVPDADLPFHRIGLPGNVNARTCPAGCASVSVEYTHPAAGVPLSGEAVAGRALDHLEELGLVDVEEILVVAQRLISPAYVVHRSPGRPELEALREQLAAAGVILAGRFGTWDYLSIEESFESGWRAGAAVRAANRV
jgi:protoporphyrinogen oxidase